MFINILLKLYVVGVEVKCLDVYFIFFNKEYFRNIKIGKKCVNDIDDLVVWKIRGVRFLNKY